MMQDIDYEYWKFIEHWPHPPQHIIDSVDLSRALGKKDAGEVTAEKNMDHGYFVQRVAKNWDGHTYVAAANYRTANDLFRDWTKENISTDFVDAGVNYTAINDFPDTGCGVSTAAHTDIVKDFTAIYLMQTGGKDQYLPPTLFWQEQGQEVYRPPQTQGLDKSLLTELKRVEIPLYTWCIIEARILHGVENLLENRIAFQISFLNNPIPDIWETKRTPFRDNDPKFRVLRFDLEQK
jgi:hypothetical protein